MTVATFPRQHRLRELDAHNEERNRRLEREQAPETVVRGATAGGDDRKLRGIPAIGRGVSGHIPGTRP